MSRIGKLPVALPEGVTYTQEGQHIAIKGSKGELKMVANDEVILKQEDNNVLVLSKSKSRFGRAIWATTRALLNNMVIGVSEGYTRVLELKGVGYRANLQGNTLVMQLGLSHEIKFDLPEGVSAAVEKQTIITLTGIDKQLLGQTAAKIRAYRPPEPYKGKGIKYAEERIIRKEGKKK